MAHRVLIAEDDCFLQKALSITLVEEDVLFDIAKDGEEAIALMDAQQPALLLLDLLMPKKDGFAVLEHMQKEGYTFPVVILSNLSEKCDRQKCDAFGVKDFFIKSDMDIDELIEKVKHLLPHLPHLSQHHSRLT